MLCDTVSLIAGSPDGPEMYISHAHPTTDKGIGSCFNYLQLASGSSIRFSEEKHRIYSSVTDSSGALVLAGKKKHISISVANYIGCAFQRL